MDIAIQEITQLISSVGFPIVCCIYMVKNNNQTLKEMSKMIQDNTVAVKNQTNLIHTLIGHFGVISPSGDSNE